MLRRKFLADCKHACLGGVASGLLYSSGCAGFLRRNGESQLPIRQWGRLGLTNGRFQKPRAMAIDANDEIYVADKTGRIQVFNTSGEFLRGWRTPEIANGKPTGLSFNNAGDLMVADTHYYRVLFYTREGELIDSKTLGGSFGPDEGQMAFVTDCVQATDDIYFVSEYGQFDRIQKYDAAGHFVARFGSHGNGVDQFSRPQSIAIDEAGSLWIADACNHRILQYDWTGDVPRQLQSFGELGTAPGQFRYPYGMLLGENQTIYVAEYGGHRVQKLTRQGVPLASWGMAGREPSQLNSPWAMVRDSKGLFYVLDSGNNRVTCLNF